MSAIYLIVFISCVLLSFTLTRGIRNLALSRGWTSTAASSRHIHQTPIPRLGGVAIFIAFIGVLGVATAFSAKFLLDTGLLSRNVLWIVGAGTVVFLLGLYDDIRSAPPAAKFLVQGLAAVMLYLGGFGVFQAPLSGAPLMWWLSLLLTVLWVLWITNAFNLIDGIDGLAAGSALFSTFTVFIVSLASGNAMLSIMSLGLAGAILGFLRFNFNPATIFLGDSGSLFIGFMLSALGLAGTQKSSTVVAVAIPVVSFGLPLLETVISVIRRFLSGKPIFAADRGHIHHKLLDRGLSQRQSVIVLYAVSAICGLLSLLLLNPSGPAVGIVLFVVGSGIWIGVQHLGYHEFIEIRRVAQRTIDQKKIIVNNLALRRASEKLQRASDFTSIFEILDQAFETNDFDRFHLELSSGARRMLDEMLRDKLLNGTYVWQKMLSEVTLGGDQLPVWSLKLDINDPGELPLGVLTIYRACNEKPLLVDINLLTSEFRAALSEAMVRATQNEDSQLVKEGHPLIAGT